MRRAISALAVATVILTAIGSATAAVGGSPAAGQRVIVVLRDQAPTANGRRSLAERAVAFRAAQAPMVSQLSRSGAQVVHTFSLVDAVSATVSAREVSALRSDPSVREVIPDRVIHVDASAIPNSGSATGPVTAPLPGACAAGSGVQLEPEGLEAIGADSDVPGAQTARSLGFDGTGVKVGYIADGVNTRNPDFLRSDGSSVFFDYKDFTGLGTGAPTGGQEAFLDSSAIAAQGRRSYDISHYSALALNQPCKIRIEGVAPGASLAGLVTSGPKVEFFSTYLGAIDYAVSTDHVDVLNESLGINRYPDDPTLDLITQADDAAVAAGTTVVVATGDAGSTNTTGSPATDPNVIAVGASTTYRINAQTGEAGARLPGITGWLNDNIGPFSSSGFDQQGRTIDLVAPGDSNWTICTANATVYPECENDTQQASTTLSGGGTSQSAPMVAGVAALVIQAYRQAHGGQSPTPAVVKRLILGTADDIGAPADQQGAGLVDAYRAVVASEEYNLTNSSAPAIPLVTESTAQLNATAAPNTARSFADTVTNPGRTAERLALTTRTLGAYSSVKTSTVKLADGGATFVTANGLTNNLRTIKFSVPTAENRLGASITWDDAKPVAHPARVTLVDPTGKLASYSFPQGDGNYGRAEVTNPVAGTWTAYVYSPDSGDGGTIGTVLFSAGVAKYITFGQVTPSSATLAAGQSTTVHVKETTSSSPGDASGAVLVTATPTAGGAGATTTVPITLRSLIPAGSTSFTGTLTGGNGRQDITGQEAYYELDVPSGAPQLNATVTLGGSPNDPFSAYLVDPHGEAIAYATNTVFDTAGNPVFLQGTQLHVVSPLAGRWRLLITFQPTVSGTAVSEPFTVTTDQTAPRVITGGLPDASGTTLVSGQSYTYSLKILNAGPGEAFYFPDPRLPGSTQVQLGAYGKSTVTEPLTLAQGVPAYSVPTHSTSVTFSASTTGAEPIQFDATGSFFSDPDIASDTGTSVSATLTAPQVESGPWLVEPIEAGVFGAARGPSEVVQTHAAVKTSRFDATMTSPTGDFEADSADPSGGLNQFAPVPANPGETATLPVTIHPRGAAGSVVTGTLFIDDFSNSVDLGFSNPIAQEVAAVPYRYTVGAAPAARAIRNRSLGKR